LELLRRGTSATDRVLPLIRTLFLALGARLQHRLKIFAWALHLA
jgi:hypothetical protein